MNARISCLDGVALDVAASILVVGFKGVSRKESFCCLVILYDIHLDHSPIDMSLVFLATIIYSFCSL